MKYRCPVSWLKKKYFEVSLLFISFFIFFFFWIGNLLGKFTPIYVGNKSWAENGILCLNMSSRSTTAYNSLGLCAEQNPYLFQHFTCILTWKLTSIHSWGAPPPLSIKYAGGKYPGSNHRADGRMWTCPDKGWSLLSSVSVKGIGKKREVSFLAAAQNPWLKNMGTSLKYYKRCSGAHLSMLL